MHYILYLPTLCITLTEVEVKEIVCPSTFNFRFGNCNLPMSSSNPLWSLSITNVKKCRVTPSPNAASPVFSTNYNVHHNHINKTKIEQNTKIVCKNAT